MKQSTFNLICLSIAIASGVAMFLLKYHVMDREKELASVRRQILKDNRELHMLKADWAVLTDPQHLRALIKELDLKPFLGKQIVHPNELEDWSMPLENEKGEITDV